MKMFIVILLISCSLNGQSLNNIEGVKFNVPCEMAYTRNIDNQNNYSCVVEDNNGHIINYSLTISNLYNDLKGLSYKAGKIFEEEFINKIENDANLRDEQSSIKLLKNNIKAISLVSYLTYGPQKFRNTELVFIYKKKSYILNLTTNDLSRKKDIQVLINSIQFN